MTAAMEHGPRAAGAVDLTGKQYSAEREGGGRGRRRNPREQRRRVKDLKELT